MIGGTPHRALPGFGPARRERDGRWARGKIRGRQQAGWIELVETQRRRVPADPLKGQLGKPGLWKWIGGANGSGPRRLFEFPGPDASRFTAEDISSLLDWARRTAGSAPKNWQPPVPDRLEQWMGRDVLTLRVAGLIRQGTLVAEPGRLALRFPVVSRAKNGRAPASDSLLRMLLEDAHNRARMARIGFVKGEGLLAEVDLSGAPDDLLPVVLPAALTALRWAVGWILETADYLASNGNQRLGPDPL